eukprot:m.155032 g.155032  ORF g.155032 m.155032 type:complete len:76 (+) comp30921_c0_seq1:81-308(+)
MPSLDLVCTSSFAQSRLSPVDLCSLENVEAVNLTWCDEPTHFPQLFDTTKPKLAYHQPCVCNLPEYGESQIERNA